MRERAVRKGCGIRMATVARGLGTEGRMRAGEKDPILSRSEEGGGNGAVWRLGMGRARGDSVSGGRPRLSWGEVQGLGRGRWGERGQRGGVNVQQSVEADALGAGRFARVQTAGVRFAQVNRRRSLTLCCTYPKRSIELRQRLLAIEENNSRRNTGIPAAARTTLCHSASVLIDGGRSVSGSGLDGWLGAAKTPCGRLRGRESEDPGVAVRRSDPSARGRMGVGAVLLSPGEGKGECKMVAAAPRRGARARKGREVRVRGWDGNCGKGTGHRRGNEGRGEGSDRESLGGGWRKRMPSGGWVWDGQRR